MPLLTPEQLQGIYKAKGVAQDVAGQRALYKKIKAQGFTVQGQSADEMTQRALGQTQYYKEKPQEINEYKDPSLQTYSGQIAAGFKDIPKVAGAAAKDVAGYALGAVPRLFTGTAGEAVGGLGDVFNAGKNVLKGDFLGAGKNLVQGVARAETALASGLTSAVTTRTLGQLGQKVGSEVGQAAPRAFEGGAQMIGGLAQGVGAMAQGDFGTGLEQAGNALNQGRTKLIGGASQAIFSPFTAATERTPLGHGMNAVMAQAVDPALNKVFEIGGIDPTSEQGMAMKEALLQIPVLAGFAKGVKMGALDNVPNMVKSPIQNVVKPAIQTLGKMNRASLGAQAGIASLPVKAIGKVTQKVFPKVSPLTQQKDLIGALTRAETKGEFAAAGRALPTLVGKKVKTFEDGVRVLKENATTIQAAKKAKLAKSKVATPLKKLLLEEKEGNISVRQNHVVDAFHQLDDYFKKTNNPLEAKKLASFKKKAETVGLTPNEIDDLAILYGKNVSKLKSFTVTGKPKGGLTAEAVENTRRGLKKTSRSFMPDEATKLMDSQISDMLKTSEMMEKLSVATQKLRNVSAPRGPMERMATGVTKFADTLLGHAPRGIFNALVKSNAGNKVFNHLELQSRIARNLKALQKVTAQIENLPAGTPPSVIKGMLQDYLKAGRQDIYKPVKAIGNAVKSNVSMRKEDAKKVGEAAKTYVKDFKNNIGNKAALLQEAKNYVSAEEFVARIQGSETRFGALTKAQLTKIWNQAHGK